MIVIFDTILETQFTNEDTSRKLFLSLSDSEKVQFKSYCDSQDAASEGIYWGYVTSTILMLGLSEEELRAMFKQF